MLLDALSRKLTENLSYATILSVDASSGRVDVRLANGVGLSVQYDGSLTDLRAGDSVVVGRAAGGSSFIVRRNAGAPPAVTDILIV